VTTQGFANMIKIQVANSFGHNVIEEPSQVTMAGMETTKHSGCVNLLGSTQQTSSLHDL
jgi:hypothetical protein